MTDHHFNINFVYIISTDPLFIRLLCSVYKVYVYICQWMSEVPHRIILFTMSIIYIFLRYYRIIYCCGRFINNYFLIEDQRMSWLSCKLKAYLPRAKIEGTSYFIEKLWQRLHSPQWQVKEKISQVISDKKNENV